MKHFHLVGIGGVGMSAIAALLLKKGMIISGSDAKESQIVNNLREAGAHIFIGHSRENVGQAVEIVVYSSAISEDNPEIRQAIMRGIPICSRAQVLSQLMEGKQVITVTGAHGKTTTASLIAYILSSAGLNPTVAIGGLSKNFSLNAWEGEGDFFVAEADESDGSFLNFEPKFSVITNIDKEHLDYYGNFNSLLDSFAKFIERVRSNGLLLINYADKNLRKLANDSARPVKSFALEKGADIWADNIRILGLGCEFDCFLGREKKGRVSLPLMGEHNIVNCLAAIILGLELGIDFGQIQEAISNYQGTKRRQELKFKSQYLLVIDDYAHHPTEIQATLRAVRQAITASNSYKKIITVFQPHRYSRTKLLLSEFSKSFNLSDQLIITDIYAASEAPIEGIDAGRLCEQIKKGSRDNVYYLEKQAIIGHILNNLSGSDVVLFLGAGDITKVADEFAKRIERI